MSDKFDIKNFDVEAVARAIEADAGESLPELREGLRELKAGEIGRINTPEEILVRRRAENSVSHKRRSPR